MRLSTDGGATWPDPVEIHDDQTPASHSFFSTSLLDDGRIAIVWLDGRGAKPGVYSTMTRDGLAVEPNRLVDDMACECCATETVQAPGGKAWLA